MKKTYLRKIAFLLAFLFILTPLIGCQNDPQPAGNETAQTAAQPEAEAEPEPEAQPEAQPETQPADDEGERKRVAVLIADMTATYAAWLAQSFEAEAANHPDLDITILDNRNDPQVQIANLENAVTQRFDMIIIQSADHQALANQINITIDAGIPVLVVNNSNEGAERASNVDADPIDQGRVPARVAAEIIPENGRVVVMLGPSGNTHSAGRRIGFQEYLFDARPDIEILEEQIGNWFKDEGMRLMEDWLQRHDQIDAVISMNDAMALGAIEAAKAVNRNHEMTYFGVDGLADAVLSIRAGDLTATCVQNAYAQAVKSLEIASRILRGEIEHMRYEVPGELITLDNVDEWIAIHTANGQIRDGQIVE